MVYTLFDCPKHKSLMEDTLHAGYAKNRNAVGHKKIEVCACALNVLQTATFRANFMFYHTTKKTQTKNA